jgi:ribonuclease J
MSPSKTDDELIFVPLGGVGEFGKNLALYGYAGHWIIVDCGMAFADETVPGVDLLVPDVSFIAEQKDRLLGLVLTHGHEDHLGGVPFVWPRLECPVYATPFTASQLARKLDEVGLSDQVPVNVVPPGGSVTLGPFEISYIRVTHSILEAHSLAIRTPAGLIVHSGDWKIDPEPLIGPLIDEAQFRALGDEGVLALIGDSTNVFVPGHSGSEGALGRSLTEIIAKKTGRVAVTTFASNAPRLLSIVNAARDNGREVVVVGRSLWRTIELAKENGYLSDLPTLLEDDEAEYLPAENTLFLITGCQGETRGAMSRISSGQHKRIAFGPGDTVIFSSKIIPGNEISVGAVVNRLIYAGVEVITEKDEFVHVSGHPGREEMVQMYEWLRPKIAVPVHGDARNLSRHAALALASGVNQTLVIENGAVVRLAPGPAAVVDHVQTGRLAIMGNKPVPIDSDSIRARRKFGLNGMIVAIIVLAEDGAVAAPVRVMLRGVGADDEEAQNDTERALRRGLDAMPRARRRDDDDVEAMARKALRGEARRLSNQRPGIEVEIIRLAETEAVSYR